MRNVKQIILSVALCIAATSCDEDTSNLDNQTSGNIAISVDETYQPIMEQQIKIFESRYPNAHIKASYKPEGECIEDFIKDTTRLIFITRVLNSDERKRCEQNKIAVTRELPLVRDAVAFIVSKDAKSEFTQAAFDDILKGKSSNQLVFDNQNSSTIRYVQDSVLKGAEMSKNTFAAKGCADVLQYVQNNKNAIGAIGVSWVADQSDTSTESFLKNINVVGILPYNDSITRYRKPYQAYIGLKEYPYCRELYFISKEGYIGLGTGFANYLGRDGQLVFSKSKLFPLQLEVRIKQVNVQ
jgi:phosphate transport system substrate-binding protein